VGLLAFASVVLLVSEAKSKKKKAKFAIDPAQQLRPRAL